MNRRYISKAAKAKENKIELVRKSSRYVTTVQYPKPDPRDRVSDEYEYDDESE